MEIPEKPLNRRDITFPRITQPPRQLLELGRCPRDGIHREISHNPQPVLHHAEEPIRVTQGVMRFVRKNPLTVKSIQGMQRVRFADGCSLLAVTQLQVLDGELHLDDAARAEFQVEVRAPLYAPLLHPMAHSINALGEILGDRLLVNEFLHQLRDSSR